MERHACTAPKKDARNPSGIVFRLDSVLEDNRKYLSQDVEYICEQYLVPGRRSHDDGLGIGALVPAQIVVEPQQFHLSYERHSHRMWEHAMEFRR